MSRPIIHRDPEVPGGTAVFGGTRVPITALFDCHEAGDSLDDFPGVSRDRAVGLLDSARHDLADIDEAAA